MTSRYRHNYEAFDRLVLAAPFMVAEMDGRAHKVLDRARVTAPFDPDDADGVHYIQAFEVESGVRESDGKRRAYGRVSNTDMPTALFVEYGFEGGVDKNGRKYPPQQRHRTLGNALDAAKH